VHVASATYDDAGNELTTFQAAYTM